MQGKIFANVEPLLKELSFTSAAKTFFTFTHYYQTNKLAAHNKSNLSVATITDKYSQGSYFSEDIVNKFCVKEKFFRIVCFSFVFMIH